MEEYYNNLYQGALDYIDGTESYSRDVFKSDLYTYDLISPFQYSGNEGLAQDMVNKVKQFINWIWNKLKSLFSRGPKEEPEELIKKGKEASKKYKGKELDTQRLDGLKARLKLSLTNTRNFYEECHKKNEQVVKDIKAFRAIQSFENRVKSLDSGNKLDQTRENQTTAINNLIESIESMSTTEQLEHVVNGFISAVYPAGAKVEYDIVGISGFTFRVPTTGFQDGVKTKMTEVLEKSVSTMQPGDQDEALKLGMKIINLHMWVIATSYANFEKAYEVVRDISAGGYFVK